MSFTDKLKKMVARETQEINGISYFTLAEDEIVLVGDVALFQFSSLHIERLELESLYNNVFGRMVKDIRKNNNNMVSIVRKVK